MAKKYLENYAHTKWKRTIQVICILMNSSG